MLQAEIFDCCFALTMKENKVETIYAKDVDRFRKYEFIKPINPLENIN